MVLDDVGTLYMETTTINDSWGKVEASNGLILDKVQGKVFLTPATKIKGNTITGDGWTLKLNDGFQLVKDELTGNYSVVKNN